MTEQEKSDLKNAVIAELKSQGTDISTATVITDADGISYVICYDTSGYISRVELKTLNANSASEDADIRSKALGYDRQAVETPADKVVITNTNLVGDKEHSFDIPAATETTAGVMSAEDKTALEKTAIADDFEFYADKDTVTLEISAKSGNITNIELPIATTEKAGVMSAADKEKLDNLTSGGGSGGGGDITAEDTDDVVENIEENLVSNALRKTPQVLVDSEKEQARKNIDAQKELTLTVKDNGNIVIGNINGQTKEFMPATPSGDPMHYAYIAAGAEYNDTDSVITKTAPWGDSVEHLPKHYYLNGLGDITEEEMVDIYAWTYPAYITDSMENFLRKQLTTDRFAVRTNLRSPNFFIGKSSDHIVINAACYNNSTIEVFMLNSSTLNVPTSIGHAFSNAKGLKHIVGNIEIYDNYSSFLSSCVSLETVTINKLKANLSMIVSPNIRKDSILYIIQNAKPTSAITITLHHDAYVRLTSDTEVVTALGEKNASLTGTNGKISLVCATHSDEIIPNA